MSTDVLDKVVTGIGEQQQAAEWAFEKLVETIADGREPEAKSPDVILTAANKSPEDLTAAVERLRERRAAAAEAARIPDIAEELASIELKLSDAEAKLEAAHEAHNGTVGPLFARREQLRAERLDAEQAGRRLAKLAPQRVQDELLAIPLQQAQLRDELRAAQDDLDRYVADLESFERKHGDRPNLLPAPTRYEEARRAAEFRERTAGAIERAKKRIRNLQRQLAETTQHEAELFQRAISVS